MISNGRSPSSPALPLTLTSPHQYPAAFEVWVVTDAVHRDPSSMDADSSYTPMKREKSSAELRKSNKPLMEKRRRERINSCLEQLKSILMEVTKKESSYYSKLEKADILEMTVKYLKNTKRQQAASTASTATSTATCTGQGVDSSIAHNKYTAGFNECTSEVAKYLQGMNGLSTDVRTRLIGHLADCLQRPAMTSSGNPPIAPAATPQNQLPGNVSMVSSTNNANPIPTLPNTAPVQLVPARLPSGDLVLLLANPQNLPVSGNQNIAPSSASSVVTPPDQRNPLNQPLPLLTTSPISPSSLSSSSTSSPSSSSSSSFDSPGPSTLHVTREVNNNLVIRPDSPSVLDLSSKPPANIHQALNLSQSNVRCKMEMVSPAQHVDNLNNHNINNNNNNNNNNIAVSEPMWRPW